MTSFQQGKNARSKEHSMIKCSAASFGASKMASSKSYDAFSSVDKLVAKPVVGSDGAAAWQDFRKETKMSAHKSVAPSMPLKKTDRLFAASFGEERLVEDQVRKETGEAAVGEGYTTFRRKNTAQDEATSRKKRKQIQNRIRPDEKQYYIAATTFEGWKFDYVFTTRDRGTGYYWDGTDSIKKLKGEDFPEATTKASEEVVVEQDEKPKRKKKKQKQAAAPVIVDDPNNPMEQVASAIRRRNVALHAAAPMGLPAGWEVAIDSSRGKTYYFCRATGERQWDRPTATTCTITAPPLPPGWSVAKDASTGKEYFYHTSSGETKWERPT